MSFNMRQGTYKHETNRPHLISAEVPSPSRYIATWPGEAYWWNLIPGEPKDRDEHDRRGETIRNPTWPQLLDPCPARCTRSVESTFSEDDLGGSTGPFVTCIQGMSPSLESITHDPIQRQESGGFSPNTSGTYVSGIPETKPGILSNLNRIEYAVIGTTCNLWEKTASAGDLGLSEYEEGLTAAAYLNQYTQVQQQMLNNCGGGTMTTLQALNHDKTGFQYYHDPLTTLTPGDRTWENESCSEPGSSLLSLGLLDPAQPWMLREPDQSCPYYAGSLRDFLMASNNTGEVKEAPLYDTPEISDSSPRPGMTTRSKSQKWAIGQGSSHRSSSKDAFLVKCKQSGMSYKEIKAIGQFPEAESTLRGRYRMLTKRKEHRVRKPGWKENDLRLLFEAVTHAQGPKISWKQVAEYIWRNGGSYQFGNATCKKKWAEIRQNGPIQVSHSDSQ
ncbi:hypothetical protein CIRG_08947 [Coccidioides immitis RMSCC 2394]|nr:hypothetical protein CIRG_08947 [Coccidioides immitis RMSCC 2394]